MNPIMPYTPSLNTAAKAQPQTVEAPHEVKSPKVAEAGGEKSAAPMDAKRFDTYEKGKEGSAPDVAGIYSLGEDEDGNPKILFDNPEQADAGEPSKAEDAPKSERDREAKDGKCTVNTDKVDAELEKLRQEMREVQQQMQAEGDADKRAQLERQLQSLESQLQTKDNDTYRKQNASYTFG